MFFFSLFTLRRYDKFAGSRGSWDSGQGGEDAGGAGRIPYF